MKPSSFISQKMDSLPEDLQCRGRQYATEKQEEKFCIDIGTQTHGWQFPDAMELLKQARARKLLSMRQDYSILEELSYLSNEKELSNARKRFLSRKGYLDDTDYESDEELISKEEMNYQKTHVSNILLASLIQSPPPVNT